MLALDGICATLGARAHEGPVTGTTRVRKRDDAGPRSKEMAFFLVLACDNEPRSVDEARTGTASKLSKNCKDQGGINSDKRGAG